MTALLTKKKLPDAGGKITRWPSKSKEKQAVVAFLAEKFAFERHYSEKEVNAILSAHHSFGDWALLRRELFERGFLARDPHKGQYWKLARQ